MVFSGHSGYVGRRVNIVRIAKKLIVRLPRLLGPVRLV